MPRSASMWLRMPLTMRLTPRLPSSARWERHRCTPRCTLTKSSSDASTIASSSTPTRVARSMPSSIDYWPLRQVIRSSRPQPADTSSTGGFFSNPWAVRRETTRGESTDSLTLASMRRPSSRGLARSRSSTICWDTQSEDRARLCSSAVILESARAACSTNSADERWAVRHGCRDRRCRSAARGHFTR